MALAVRQRSHKAPVGCYQAPSCCRRWSSGSGERRHGRHRWFRPRHAPLQAANGRDWRRCRRMAPYGHSRCRAKTVQADTYWRHGSRRRQNRHRSHCEPPCGSHQSIPEFHHHAAHAAPIPDQTHWRYRSWRSGGGWSTRPAAHHPATASCVISVPHAKVAEPSGHRQHERPR